IDGHNYTVPEAFVGMYTYFATAGAGAGPNVLGQTVGELRAYLPSILSLIKSYDWHYIKDLMEQFGTHDDPENAEGYAAITAFAAGDFSIIEQALDALYDFLAPFPDSMSTLEAFA